VLPPISPDRILQTGLSFWASKVVLSGIELGVWTVISQGHGHFDDLSRELRLHPRAARDFLDALVALGLLVRTNDEYANTTEANMFLDRAKPMYVGSMVQWFAMSPWHKLTEALRTGQPQGGAANGNASVFDSVYATPAKLREFLRAMTALSHGANQTIARRFPWTTTRTFVDVGTAEGDLATQVALANPRLRGIGFDLPAVQPIFHEYVVAAGVADRLTFRPGNFFEDSLPGADVVMMGHILHDWDLATKKMLIRKAFEALSPGGSLIVYESLIDDDRSTNAFALMMSLNMLLETPGGFDYSGADCRGWMLEAGFSEVRIEPLLGPDAMVVAVK
jgi:hypothetical protein